MLEFVEDPTRAELVPLHVVIAVGEPMFGLGVASACAGDGLTVSANTQLGDDVLRECVPRGGCVVVGDALTLGRKHVDELVEHGIGVALFMDGGADREQIAVMVRSGARGILDRTASASAIIHAVRAVSAGRFALSDHAQLAMLGAANPTQAQPSPREMEVLRLMAEGCTAREIAAALFVTEATVKTHVQRLGQKLGERRRAGMVLRAHRLGLLTLAPNLSLIGVLL